MSPTQTGSLPEITGPEDDPDCIYLRLSAQRALLGTVGPLVRGVSVSYEGQMIVVEARVDAGITEAEREGLDDVSTDIVADYPEGWGIELRIRDAPDDLPRLMQPRWPVYARRDT